MFSLIFMTEKRKTGGRSTYFSKLGETFKVTRFDKKRFWKTFFIDLVYSVVVVLILGLFFYIAYPKLSTELENFNSLATSGILESGATEQILPLLVPIISVLLGYIVIFLLIRFFLSVAFKGWIWRTIFKKKMSRRFYFKYLGFRLIVGIALIVVFALAVLVTNILNILFLLGGILLTHLFAVSLIYFVRDSIVWKSFKKGFGKGIKVHLFLLPYLFFLGLLLVRGLINGLLEKILVRNPQVITNLQELIVNLVPHLKATWHYIVITTIIGLLFMAYMRIWYAEFVDRL